MPKPTRSLLWILPFALGAVMAVVLPARGTPQPDQPAERAPLLPDQGARAIALGLVFQRAPVNPVTPTTVAGRPSLRDIRVAVREGRTQHALYLAESLVAQARWGAERDAAWMLIGHLHRDAARHNLASEAFTKVRAGKGRLATEAAFYEAEQDFFRGKPHTAIKECEALKLAAPESPHLDTCTRLTALAWAREGGETRALEAARLYDKDRSLGLIEEQVQLELGRWEAKHRPKSAVNRLRKLASEFDAPLTGSTAEALLARLHEEGHVEAAAPTDLAWLQARAVSLRNSGRLAEAVATFDTIAALGEHNPEAARWAAASAEVFAWRTRTFDRVEALLQAKYAEKPDSDTLWQLHKAQGRGGRWAAAAKTAEIGLERHGRGGPWKYDTEVVARTFMLAGQYKRATQVFDGLAGRGGWSGRRASFYAAFSAHQGGDHAEAIRRYTALIDKNNGMVAESTYWRGVAHHELGQTETAKADFEAVAANRTDGWYALLARQRLPETSAAFQRDGRWPGAAINTREGSTTALTPTLSTEVAPPAPAPLAAPVRPRSTPAALGFGLLAFPLQHAAPLPAPPAPALPFDLLIDPPPSYQDGPVFNEEQALSDLGKLATAWAETWPELGVIHDYASLGLYDLAGPLMAEFHEEWREALRSGGHRRHAAARKLELKQEHWRPLFLVSRDHHHTSRYLYGLHTEVADPKLALGLQRLAWPLAHDRAVWEAGRSHDVDPLMVMGLMRQESNYSPIATSRVGASGAMQIMPRTGHLLADLVGDAHFTAGDLEDPVLSVRYGIRYLGLLFERFEGVYPLAVASYNGGPHNVSSWLQGTNARPKPMQMDAFVEHIPFRETRDYVMKVSSGYATYVDLYAPTGSAVKVPERPRGDHPKVVDF